MNWAWSVESLTPTERLTLLALADYADEKHSCFPGQEKLAERVCVSSRTIIRTIATLEDRGLVSRELRFRESGPRTSNRYYLNLGANMSLGEVDQVTSTTDQVTLMSVSREPSVEPPDTPYSPSSDNGFDEIWKAWPRKDSKAFAKRKWGNLSQKKRDEITPLLISHANAHRTHSEPKYIPHLSTWLNGERWDDPLPGAAQGAGPAAVPQIDPDEFDPNRIIYREGRIWIPRGWSAIRNDEGHFTHYEEKDPQ